jgi:3-oxoacyl-[acyl-carrier protein] reductase
MNEARQEPGVVLVTGAAGGLGRALAAAFGGRGWRIAAGYHRSRPDGGEDDVWWLEMDVTRGSQVEEGVGNVSRRWGRIDVLINNAGVIADHPVWQLEETAWDRALDVNLKGAMRCSRAVAGGMIRQGGGQIINIGSFAARAGHAGQANYVAAKAGLIGFTQSLARELGTHNIRVNAVLPGVMRTGMTAGLDEERRTELAGSNALGRLNSTEEVAGFVAFLATMDNVSGQVFQLDSRIARWT